jgi:hypothetical protein
MLHINGNKKYEKKVVENNETYLSWLGVSIIIMIFQIMKQRAHYTALQLQNRCIDWVSDRVYCVLRAVQWQTIEFWHSKIGNIEAIKKQTSQNCYVMRAFLSLFITSCYDLHRTTGKRFPLRLYVCNYIGSRDL